MWRNSRWLASVTPYPDLPSLHFAHNADALDAPASGFTTFEYERERERGLDHQEDLYSPFLLHFDLAASPSASLIASTLRHESTEARTLEDTRIGAARENRRRGARRRSLSPTC